VSELHAVAAQVDPNTATVATATPRLCTAELDVFAVLGAALGRVVENTRLGPVVGWQHRGHGTV